MFGIDAPGRLKTPEPSNCRGGASIAGGSSIGVILPIVVVAVLVMVGVGIWGRKKRKTKSKRRKRRQGR